MTGVSLSTCADDAQTPVDDALVLVRVRRLLRTGQARQIREEAGLSQVEAARSISVDPSALCRWEAGQRVPRAKYALAYAELLRELAQ